MTCRPSRAIVRGLSAVLALTGVVLGPGACTARTLPLPPPDVDPIQGPNALGLVQVSGTAQEGAAVGVLNETTGRGVIVTSPMEGCDQVCPFEAELEAEAGDALRIWQFFETSSAAERIVP
jgi:hypothetical protein